jgi:CRP-like cAMP-binding protein
MVPMTDQAALRDLPLFEGLSPAELAWLEVAGEEVEADAGEVVVREGRNEHEFFVILAGTASVLRADEEVARLGAGQFFGETALLTGAPRNATVAACEPMRLLVIPEDAFHELVGRASSFAATVRRSADSRPARSGRGRLP